MTEDAKRAERAAPLTSAAVVAWGLAMYAGARAIEVFLEAQSMATGVGQAMLVEWGSSRVGVAWTDPRATIATGVVARRAARGLALGLGLSGVLFAVLAATRAVALERVASVAPSVLAIGLAAAALSAWRDELLLHGVALRAASGVGAVGQVLACGATSAGAALGRGDATARSVFAAALLGVIFGALWVRDRGAWQPFAAHAAFRFSTGTLFAGGVVHGRVADGAWAGGSAGVLGGAAATIALAPFAVLAVAWAARGISPRSASVG